MDSRVSIVKCKSYDPFLIQGTVRKAIDLLGGISSFIKPKSKVLVKPNLLMAKQPEYGITTHPEVVRAVVKILKEIDCQIYLGDSPSVWGKQIGRADEVYEETGMKDLSKEEGVELVKFDKRRWRGKFPLSDWLYTCDYLVSVPKFKTHNLTLLTGAIKNLFGLVTGTYKTELHKNYFSRDDFATILVDIYEEAKPVLTVIDGIVAMEGDGPSSNGKLRNMGLLLAGSDCVALDTILALIMGIEPFDILTTQEAAGRGLGTADIDSILVLGEKLEDIIGEPFKLPSTSLEKKIPRPIVELTKKLIRFYPKVDYNKCNLCGSCVEICPNKIISIRRERIFIDYSGCISCFCCQESCPNAAMKVKKSILTKLIGL